VVSIDRTFEDYFRTDGWDIVAEYVEPQVVPGERLGGLKGVKLVEEYAKGNVKIIGPSGSKVLQAVGLDYPSKLKSHDVVKGRLPSGQRGEVIVYRKLADEIGAKLGDTVKVKGVELTLPMKIVGITTFSPEQVYVEKEDAQLLLKQEHKVTGALVQIDPGANIDDVAALIRGQKSVGNLYEKAAIVSALKVHSKELLAVISIAIALAILVACLVIASTVIINVLEREPDYATLRVQGFEVKKVQRGILGEVMVTGLIGALLSVPLSFAISEFLNNQMGQAFFYVKTVVEPASVIVVVVLALAFMPIAAWPGMRRVRRINLAEAVRRKAMG
jgi:putative ABC transport system permease protein